MSGNENMKLPNRLLLVTVFFVGSAGSIEGLKADDFRLQTDDTLLVLRAAEDALNYIRLGPAGSQSNWLGEPVSFDPQVPVYLANGSTTGDWRLKGVRSASDEASRSLVAKFEATDAPLTITSVWRCHPGPGPIELTLTVANHSAKRVDVGAVPSLSLRLVPPPDSRLDHWWVEKGGGKPSDEGTHRTEIGPGFSHRAAASPWAKKYGSDEPIPWQCFHDTTDRHGLYMFTASSAHVFQEASTDTSGQSLQVAVGIDAQAAPFRTTLEPGESVTFPPAFVGCFAGTIDDGCNRLHRWVEQTHIPQRDNDRLPLVVNNSFGRRFDIDEESCKSMIDHASHLGFEMYHIDAGWYREVGWWQPDPKKFPRGLRPISDYAHRHGMKFGLWVAWTQGGHVRGEKEALSVFAPEMADWFPTDAPADWQAHPWSGRACCLASPQARAWCLRELRRIVRDYRLDMLEHDQQMITFNCTRSNHGHTDSSVDAGFRASEGFYSIYDTLRREFPDLIIENCVNGGCTVDLGVMGRCDYVSITDTYEPMSNRRAFYDASFPLPPRMLESYVAAYPAPTLDVFRYMLRSGMMGWCTVMIDTRTWSPEQQQVARRQIEVYKEKIRPMIRDGNLYHVSDRPRPDGWDAIEYASADGQEGLLMVFRAKSDESKQTFRLQGLVSDAKYRVTFQDRPGKLLEATGDELMSRGLIVELPSPESSDIVYFVRL